jgi:hypothetical protein
MSEAEGGFHIVATYREIAEHFGLKGPDQGRIKARRAGWGVEPRNHPADPIRVRVPREVWTGAVQARERGLSRRRDRRGIVQREKGPFQADQERPVREPEIPQLIKQLEAVHQTLREQLERAEERAAAAQREALAQRLEAERLRAELTAWTSSGRLVRAWRGLLFRRAGR